MALSPSAAAILERLRRVEAGDSITEALPISSKSIMESLDELEANGLVYLPEEGELPRLTAKGESYGL